MRIAGITLPENKRIEIGLTSIYGIGISMSRKILAEAKVNAGIKVKEINAAEENAIRTAVETNKIEGDLKRDIASNIKRLKDIKSYKGIRHMRHLPVDGQRTKTNSRTVRGNIRKTMGSGRKLAEKK